MKMRVENHYADLSLGCLKQFYNSSLESYSQEATKITTATHSDTNQYNQYCFNLIINRLELSLEYMSLLVKQEDFTLINNAGIMIMSFLFVIFLCRSRIYSQPPQLTQITRR